MATKAVMIVLSGIAGDPVDAFRGLTPLEQARLPAIDRMASEGITGIMHVAGKGIVPTPGEAGFLLLGMDPPVPGARAPVPRFTDKFGVHGAFVSGSPVMEVPCMSAMLTPALTEHDDALDKKLAAAIGALDANEFVLLHLHATDTMHAAGDHAGLVGWLERIDAGLVGPLARAGSQLVMAVTTDHHRSASGDITASGVPVLIHGDGVRPDHVQRFTERECRAGGLVEIEGRDLVYILLDLLGKVPKFGLEDD